jgi:hypothetical protein
MAYEIHELLRNKATPNQKFLRGDKKMKGGRVESEKMRKLTRRLQASIPGLQTIFFETHNIRHFAAFNDDSVQSKKPSGGPKGLIGPPCHGALAAGGIK